VWKFPRFRGTVREREGEREREGGQCTDTHYKTRSKKREDIGMDKYGEKTKYRKEKSILYPTLFIVKIDSRFLLKDLIEI